MYLIINALKHKQNSLTKKSIKRLKKGLTPKYQRFTMTDWVVQSVIFMSKTTRKQPENEVRVPKYSPETITKSS